MQPLPASETTNSRLAFVIGLVILGYLAAAALGLPQAATAEINHVATAEEFKQEEHKAKKVEPPPLWSILPFVVLLGLIAILPLLPTTAHWWEKNRNKFLVAAILAAVTVAFYLVLHERPVEAHWPRHRVVEHNPEGMNLHITEAVLANALLHEYIPFITLLFSLYTITGGIRLEGDLKAHPLTNTLFLAVGGVLASFIGTTGAAMLLIRPLLETNKERKHVRHTVIFFIFIVCNCGGCLLPIGDPPLFLGYLLGVPFLWTLKLWKEWLLVNGILLVVYYLWDRFWYYPREKPADILRDETRVRPLRLMGVWPNVLLLLAVVAAVELLDPKTPVPFVGWHAWWYLREMILLGLVWLSLVWSKPEVRAANNFNYVAIVEVAALFFGIFVAMQPPLQILALRGSTLGLTEVWQYFWLTGCLSSFLDNAPTYVVFYEMAHAVSDVLPNDGYYLVNGVRESLLEAVSLGAVFMGANTYIGNGPNFMVKTIAESSGVKMPSFFGYMAYSCIILLPLFLLVTWLFFL